MKKVNKTKKKKLLSYLLLLLEAHTADWWKELGRKEGYEQGKKDAWKEYYEGREDGREEIKEQADEIITNLKERMKRERIATLEGVQKWWNTPKTKFDGGDDFKKWLEQQLKEAKG